MTAPASTYSFDDDFQQLIAALTIKDTDFVQRTESLVRPEYFASEIDASLVSIVLTYFATYRKAPEKSALVVLLKDALAAKRIRKELWEDTLLRLKELFATDISDKTFAIDKVAEFARNQAMETAILQAAELHEKRDYRKVEDIIKQALMVGENQDDAVYSHWDNILGRAQTRQDLLAGKIKPTGITTGQKKLDDLLYHKGWGRKELSCIMGPAKSGKSMSLLTFAIGAAQAKHNVIYVSLEVSTGIIADRMDANISNVPMKDLQVNLGAVRDRVHAVTASAGRLDLVDFPSGSFKTSDLRRLLHRRAARGMNYDLVVLDYADLMAPNQTTDVERDNSKRVYVELRALAWEFNCAMLTATQTNREGFKAAVGKMEHVAEDINKARTVDLLISLNATDDEKAKGEARYYFAASRNQKGDICVVVKNNMETANAIKEILRIDA